MDVKELEQYVEACDWTPREFVIEMGDDTIRMLLRPFDRPTWERALKDCEEQKQHPKTKQWAVETNPRKLRRWLSKECITGWEGWTKGLVARLASRTPLNGDRTKEANEAVPYSPEVAFFLLDTIIGLDGQIIEEVIKRADERAKAEVSQKNG